MRSAGGKFSGLHRGRFSQELSYATAMALTAVTVFALAAIVAASGKERKGTVFGVGA